MTSIITRTGKGSELSYAEMDGNFDSLNGINEVETGTTYTVVAADQNKTKEFSNASPVAVTLTDIATLLAAGDTSDFKATLKNIGAGAVTVTRGGTDTFEDGSTSVTLTQYQYIEIQSDSAGTAWNVINGDYTQTYVGKTLTSPALNSPTFSGGQIATFQVSSGGTISKNPAGWSVAKGATGVYTLTHSLGLSDTLAQMVFVHDASGGGLYLASTYSSKTANAITYLVRDLVAGTSIDIAHNVLFTIGNVGE